MTALLEVEDLVVRYGQAIAVDGVSLRVGPQERVALIGPNGAGKSSLLNAVCGVVRPASGRVRINGDDVTGSTPAVVVRRGVSQVPEGRHVFATLPVEANLQLGAYGRFFSLEIVSSTLRYLRHKPEVRERLERVYTLLPKLRELRERPAGRTSGGEQQMVAIGRALMAEPRLLAIDELSLGLAPLVVDQLVEFLVRLNTEEGVAILLVDQNARLAFGLCERAYVLETGRLGTGGAERGAGDPARGAQRLPRRRLGAARVTTFLQLIVVGISTGSVFGLVGMALVLVYRTTGIVNFAQGVSAVLGGLLTFELQQHMPLALAIVGAIVLAALLATLTAVIAVGFRGRTTHLASLIITVGIALLAEAILLATFGEVPRSYPGISEHAWDIGGVLVQPQYLLITVVAIAAAAGLTFFLRRTIVGQALVASADSPRAAELVGLNVRSIAVIAFAVAAALCALGGALLAPTVPVVYNSDLAITINGFAAAVFGGLASIRLALLGGYALGIVEQLVVGYVDPQYNLTIALVAMLILIGWRSRGELAV